MVRGEMCFFSMGKKSKLYLNVTRVVFRNVQLNFILIVKIRLFKKSQIKKTKDSRSRSNTIFETESM